MTGAVYYSVRLSEINRSQVEELTEVCFAHGALGTAEVLDYFQDPDTCEVTTLEKEWVEQDVFFNEAPAPEFLRDLKDQFPETVVRVSEEQVRDWMEEWKKGFVAFPLVTGPTGASAWVVPSWLPAPEGVKDILRIDPGLAFGTGTHATTQLVAKMLADLPCWGGGSSSSPQVLDVGTGTGILAILAARLGSPFVDALEIDALARATALENVCINQVEDRVRVREEPLAAIVGTYEIVVANIIDGILVHLADDLKARVKEGGYLLLTGIMTEREEIFQERFSFAGDWRLLRRETLEEWTGYILQRDRCDAIG